jgi:hypothetical protein
MLLTRPNGASFYAIGFDLYEYDLKSGKLLGTRGIKKWDIPIMPTGFAGVLAGDGTPVFLPAPSMPRSRRRASNAPATLDVARFEER